MPQQVLLRQLTRRLRPGTLAGFWQGSYTLQPWNHVANSAYTQAPPPQGQTWDTGADFGFAAHSHITNPSTGLDSIYQKHVWSRLGTAEPPEGSDSDGTAQTKALAAAAAFATLQPAAAAAALDDSGEDPRCKAKMAIIAAPLKSAPIPPPVMDIAADAASDIQLAAATGALAAGRRTGLSTIPEEPVEAALTASTGTVAEQVEHAEEGVQRRRSPAKSVAAEAAPESGVQGSPHTAGKANAASQEMACLSDSVAALQECQSSAAADSPPADGGLEALGPQSGRGSAKELLPLPVLTGSSSLKGSGTCKQTPQEVLAAAMQVARTQPSPQDRQASSTENSTQHAKQPLVQHSYSRGTHSTIEEGMQKIHHVAGMPKESSEHVRPATLVRSSASGARTPSGLRMLISSPAAVVSQSVSIPLPMSHARAETSPGEDIMSRASTIGAAALISSPNLQPKSAETSMQASYPDQPLNRRHVADSVPAVHVLPRPEASLRLALRAIHLLLDLDTVKLVDYMPGFVVAKGQVCGREVHACYLDTGGIAQSSKHAACGGLCSMVDSAILAGTPVVTIHGACNPHDTPEQSLAGAAMAGDLAVMMPAVQRHMDASGVVPHLAVSLGQLSAISSLLVSASDYTLSGTATGSNCCAPNQDGSHHDSSSGSGVKCSQRLHGSQCCTQNDSLQESSSILCFSVEDALHKARQLLVMLPSNNGVCAPKVPCHDPPWRACNGLQALSSLDLCSRLADAGLIAGGWAAAGTAVCFGRLDRTTVGLVVMPCRSVIPGAFSRRSLAQVTKAVRFCSAFSLPIVSVLLMHQPQTLTEGQTSITNLANLIFAYSEAAVPKLAVLCGPEALTDEKCLKSDVALLWTSNNGKRVGDQQSSPTASLEQSGSPVRHVSIKPEDTRAALCSALKPLLDSRIVATPRRKHALLPIIC